MMRSSRFSGMGASPGNWISSLIGSQRMSVLSGLNQGWTRETRGSRDRLNPAPTALRARRMFDGFAILLLSLSRLDLDIAHTPFAGQLTDS